MIVEHTGEELRVLLTTQHLPHIAWRHYDLIHLMYVSVQTGHVTLHHLIPEDVCTLRIINACTHILATQYAAISVSTSHGDVIVQHLLTGEMHYHRYGTIINHVDTFLIVVPPIGIALWHRCPRV